MSAPNPSWHLRWLTTVFATLAVLAAITTAHVTKAHAKPTPGPPWLKLDRVEAEPIWLTGMARVRVYVSAVDIHGKTLPIGGKIGGKKPWTLQVGSSKKRGGYLSGNFGALRNDDVALYVVICTSSAFSAELPKIKAAVQALIEKLPKTAKVGIIGYGSDINGSRRLGSQRKALSILSGLDADTVPGDNQLIKAVQRAVRGFKKAAPSAPGRHLRKTIIVVSDGEDIEHTAKRFRSVAKRADRKQIRVHTLAYSNVDRRRPMLGLAELSKRTHGTFRLVRTADSFGQNLHQLSEEMANQYVLTYYLPLAEVTGKRLKVLARELTSNEFRLKKITCGGETCEADQYCAAGRCVARASAESRGALGWVLYIGGGALALLAVLVLIGWLLTKRQQKKAGDAALAQAAFEAASATDIPPPGRIVPQGAQGGIVAPTAPRVSVAQPAAPRVPGAASVARPAAAASIRGSLYVLKGIHQGKSIPVHHGLRIGKAPDCDIVLSDDGFASSYHAHIEIDKGGNASFVDDKSTNGSFVNGVRAGRNRLSHGMLIRVGQTEMRFMLG